jgi:multiple sugar transport system ATP-binding protein
MNFATVRVDGASLVLGSTRLELTGSAARAAAQRPGDSSVILGFRPEHMALADGAGPSAVRLPATVDVVEYLGHEELIHAQAEGTEIVALIASDQRLQAGQHVQLAIPAEKLHLFDPDTEERLVG